MFIKKEWYYESSRETAWLAEMSMKCHMLQKNPQTQWKPPLMRKTSAEVINEYSALNLALFTHRHPVPVTQP